MANLVIKPASGSTNKLVFQNQAGNVDAITVEDSGAIAIAGNTTLAGTANNLGTITSATTFPAGHVVNITRHLLEEYAVVIGTTYAGDKSTFVQIGSESWDVVLKQANSNILILGYFTYGNAANMIHFDMKFGGTGGTWVSESDGSDAMSAEHRPGTEDKMNVGLSFLHDPGTQAVGTTLTYVPYLGGTGTFTLQVNNYTYGYSLMECTSHFNFLEIAV